MRRKKLLKILNY